MLLEQDADETLRVCNELRLDIARCQPALDTELVTAVVMHDTLSALRDQVLLVEETLAELTRRSAEAATVIAVRLDDTGALLALWEHTEASLCIFVAWKHQESDLERAARRLAKQQEVLALPLPPVSRATDSQTWRLQSRQLTRLDDEVARAGVVAGVAATSLHGHRVNPAAPAGIFAMETALKEQLGARVGALELSVTALAAQAAVRRRALELADRAQAWLQEQQDLMAWIADATQQVHRLTAAPAGAATGREVLPPRGPPSALASFAAAESASPLSPAPGRRAGTPLPVGLSIDTALDMLRALTGSIAGQAEYVKTVLAAHDAIVADSRSSQDYSSCAGAEAALGSYVGDEWARNLQHAWTQLEAVSLAASQQLEAERNLRDTWDLLEEVTAWGARAATVVMSCAVEDKGDGPATTVTQLPLMEATLVHVLSDLHHQQSTVNVIAGRMTAIAATGRPGCDLFAEQAAAMQAAQLRLASDVEQRLAVVRVSIRVHAIHGAADDLATWLSQGSDLSVMYREPADIWRARRILKGVRQLQEQLASRQPVLTSLELNLAAVRASPVVSPTWVAAAAAATAAVTAQFQALDAAVAARTAMLAGAQESLRVRDGLEDQDIWLSATACMLSRVSRRLAQIAGNGGGATREELQELVVLQQATIAAIGVHERIIEELAAAATAVAAAAGYLGEDLATLAAATTEHSYVMHTIAEEDLGELRREVELMELQDEVGH